ncbi:MAG: DUF1844 domain-containing protein [candidate division Zixibacteria bacterium]|nr:DUF1844 domain-containing protein [candidate division Zixibacteria bacterium]MBU1469203.1 DUF1844 domain-containing protein [candidate division Zixibacteria bacterium]MBU2626559.1 DUF1844 domain-containing protein [candidate division Zixibacteria bacterium]
MTEDIKPMQVDPHLIQLIVSLEAAAMQQMGKLQNSITGKVERDLGLAKNSIDMLTMIQTKTDGNLTDDEATLMKRTLFQLRMNYVDELNSEKKAASERKGDGHAESDAAEQETGESTNASEENK